MPRDNSNFLTFEDSTTSHNKGQLTVQLVNLCSYAGPRAVELRVDDLPALRHDALRADA